MRRFGQNRPWAGVVAGTDNIRQGDYRFITAIRNADAWCLTLTLPATDTDELRQMLSLKLEELSPLPAEETVWSFLPLERMDKETRVLLVIASKKAVDGPVTALEAAGISAEVVGVDALAVFRQLVRDHRLPGDNASHLFVWLENDRAALIGHARGLPLVVRAVLTVDPEDWRAEIERTQTVMQLEQPDLPAGNVVIVPATEEMRSAAESLREKFGTKARCLAQTEIPLVSEALRAGATADDNEGLNLLSEEWHQRRRATEWRSRLVWGAVASAGVYVLALAIFGAAYGVQRWRLNDLNQQRLQLQPSFASARETHVELAALEARLDTQQTALEVLREVSGLTPTGARLTGFSFKKNQGVTLRGETSSSAKATEFIGQLERCRLFVNVKTLSMPTMQDGLTKFEVVCSLPPAGGGVHP